MSSPTVDEDDNFPSSYRPLSRAERIRQLNEVDKSITQLLQSAGLALKTLSNAHSDSSVIQTPPSANTRKELFSFSANTYLTTLQSIDVRLQRSIIGLEEAGITVPGRLKKDSGQDLPSGAGARGQPSKQPAEVGLGNLDVGWLNSRSGRVGREMEAELWAKAKVFLEGLDDEKAEDDKHKSPEDTRDDEAMEP